MCLPFPICIALKKEKKEEEQNMLLSKHIIMVQIQKY
jgi:hypothetical protein